MSAEHYAKIAEGFASHPALKRMREVIDDEGIGDESASKERVERADAFFRKQGMAPSGDALYQGGDRMIAAYRLGIAACEILIAEIARAIREADAAPSEENCQKG